MDNSSQSPLVLVDGSSYLYRAYHALPPLTNSKGQATGAIKGVINMMRRLQKDYPGCHAAVIFDAKGKTFRDDMYPAYKAQRPPMPDDLRSQIEPIQQIIKAMGFPLIVVPGVEADDVIGTFAAQATEAKVPVVISTGDKDMAQLVNEHVTLVNTMTDTVMDPAGVVEKFGIGPELIIDFLALMGDKVDNIPGVAGVGEKTAKALLQGLGSLESIYQRLDDIKDLTFRGAKTMKAKLEKERENADMSYRLATIKCDVELEQHLDELVMADADVETLRGLFAELEFRGWVKEIDDPNSVVKPKARATTAAIPTSASAPIEADIAIPDAPSNTNYQTVLTEADFDAWLVKLQQAELFAFDTETTSINYMEARIVGVSFATEEGSAAYVPFGHDYIDAPEQLTEAQVLGRLKPLLENENKAKVGQNLKYDRHVLQNHGIELKGIAHDTMLQSYVINSVGSRHNMDALALKYLDIETVHFEDIAGKGVKQLSFNQIALEQAGPYAAEDADITLRLHHVLYPQLLAEPSLLALYQQVEMPLLTVLGNIEKNGTRIDADMLLAQSAQLGERMEELKAEAYDLAGQEFNLGSPKQLGEVLFEKLELPVIKKTPKGKPSTAEEVLVELALDYPLPKVIIEYRGLSKLKSTYTDKLPEMVCPDTNRIHTSYHQAVTATGRLSSSDPNLQNIPVRSGEGRRIRNAFIPAEGYKMVAADYSQIELRIMAHLSGDAGLRHAFANGLDVHRATAAEVFGVELAQVSDDQRRSAKAINFGLIYGMSAFGLAKQLGLGRNKAQEYIERYFERYPGVAQYMDDIKRLAKEKGYVETLYGRRLYLPEINGRNGMRRQAAERTAINAPMQGTAADIIKKAMIDVERWIEAENIDARMVMQVHDELVLEVNEQQLEVITAKIEQIMEQAVALSVPLIVDAGRGDNWEQAH
ncbi:DNA polymerase I [Sinobacterium norvegicum]|uniref:DNA polymerase I n=1 Tax=Sinobacterium norvegicum TaxID=1641715 RepID=A0ABN8EKN8_9GAMM|nr:DNA polymerase I [Sinobacterium norvegicum]CAH0992976.1 DNA polymerase I [Sinobacterium norvegicum]